MSLPDLSKASGDFWDVNPHLTRPSGVFPKGTLGQVLLEPEEEPMTKAEARSERELQDQIAGHLERHGTVVIRSRMDRKTTTAVGTPDLLFALKGMAVAMEVKLPGKKPTKEQDNMMLRMTGNGWACYVVHSYDEAVLIINKLFLNSTLDTR